LFFGSRHVVGYLGPTGSGFQRANLLPSRSLVRSFARREILRQENFSVGTSPSVERSQPKKASCDIVDLAKLKEKRNRRKFTAEFSGERKKPATPYIDKAKLKKENFATGDTTTKPRNHKLSPETTRLIDQQTEVFDDDRLLAPSCSHPPHSRIVSEGSDQDIRVEGNRSYSDSQPEATMPREPYPEDFPMEFIDDADEQLEILRRIEEARRRESQPEIEERRRRETQPETSTIDNVLLSQQEEMEWWRTHHASASEVSSEEETESCPTTDTPAQSRPSSRDISRRNLDRVRCFGCQRTMWAPKDADLVCCPHCLTVGPATSRTMICDSEETRRRQTLTQTGQLYLDHSMSTSLQMDEYRNANIIGVNGSPLGFEETISNKLEMFAPSN